MRRLGLGLVGAGRMGRVHAEIVARELPNARLTAVADLDEAAALELASALDCRASTRHHDMLGSDDVDAILVVTSTHSHGMIIADAANAGKHIFCEKPIALTIDETRAAVATARAAGVRLQVGLYRRHDPDYQRARERIGRGDIGSPQLFRSLQYDVTAPPPEFCDPTSSGGIAVDMGIHEFDVARWLMDDEIVEVHAIGSDVAEPQLASVGDVGACIISVRFASGAIGTVELARRVGYAEDVRTEVVGTVGSVLVGTLPASHSTYASDGRFASDLAPSAFARFRPALVAQLRAFCEAILDDREVEPTGQESLAALAAGIAARQSLELGRPVPVDPTA